MQIPISNSTALLITIQGALLAICAMLTSGCISAFNERHHFQTVDSDGEATNYYRLDVVGYTVFSGARYVSGYYDERAVDQFFDEVQLGPTTSESPDEDPEDPKNPEDSTFRPLSPNADNGAFVMVLSSDASAVTSTIGQFAENQIVAQAITNIANRDLIIASQGGVGSPLFEVEQAAVSSREIVGLMELVPVAAADTAPDPVTALLQVLNAIARARGHYSSFSSFPEARKWFDGRFEGERQ